MTGDPDPAAAQDDAHPTLAQEAGTAVSAAVLRLAYMTGAQIIEAPPWPGASFTEEQPEPGAGIRIALALERAARAGVRVFIQRAREAGMSWAQVGEALGVAELARAAGEQPGRGRLGVRGGAVGAPERAAGRVPVDLPGLRRGRERPGTERREPGRGRAGARRGLPASRGRRRRVARPGRLTRIRSHHACTKTARPRPATVNLCHATSPVCPAHACFSSPLTP